MAKEKKIKITLVKSLIGRLPQHVATADALGLRKMHRSVEVIDNPSIRGMINRINYMVQVEEL